MLEAFEGYWRKAPSVKRLVMKVIPEESTRLAALKRGEVDIAYSIRGELAEELQHTPGLTLKPVVLQAPYWLYFPDQWDAKSPWHDLRVRQAANLALDRDGMNEALFLGYCRPPTASFPTLSTIYGSRRRRFTIPTKAKKLLAEAGHAGGFDAGLYYCDSSYANIAEASSTTCRRSASDQTAADRARRLLAGFTGKKLRAGSSRGPAAPSAMLRRGWPRLSSRAAPLSMAATPISTNCSRSRRTSRSREAGRDPGSDAAARLREAIYAPIWQLAFFNGVGPRVGDRPSA